MCNFSTLSDSGTAVLFYSEKVSLSLSFGVFKVFPYSLLNCRQVCLLLHVFGHEILVLCPHHITKKILGT